MNFQFYVEKLKSFEKFEKFIKENSDAFCCSGFFIIDTEGKDNQQHFDYYLPKEKVDYYKVHDALVIGKKHLTELAGLSENDILEIEKLAMSEIKGAIDFAIKSPEMSKDNFLKFVEEY